MPTALQSPARYYRPTTVGEAIRLLSDERVRTVPLAGGTDLLSHQNHSVEAVVDLQDLGLDYVRAGGGHLRIGAMTRLQTLVDNSSIRQVANEILATCAASCAQFTERNAATVGGTVAAAAASNDLLPAMLVLDAEVVLTSASVSMNVPLETFLAGRSVYLERGVLITEIVLRLPAMRVRAAYQRVSRTPADSAIVGVAGLASADGGRLRGVRIAAAGVAAAAVRLSAAEAALEGQPPAAECIAEAARQGRSSVIPSGDHRASSQYRQAMLEVLLRRVLSDICGLIRKGHTNTKGKVGAHG